MVEPFGEGVQRVSNSNELVSFLTFLLVCEHHESKDVSDRQIDSTFLLVVVAAVDQKAPKSLFLNLFLVNHGLSGGKINKF